jgi:hypothetical protein
MSGGSAESSRGPDAADAAQLSADSSGLIQIGRYRATREMGRGGMGVVYEAVDPAIGRRVAIKVINLQSFTGPGEAQMLRERLFREARSAGALSHPGIVIVYDVGEDHERAFIAMEFVEGPSLQQAQQFRGTLAPGEVVGILRQVASALDYAHKNGVVHRDIKPANIMLHLGSHVKIADFGIAKITTAPKYTVTGLVMGTPAYMSPEQIEGREIDGRSDQFSLAVVAYELLTGTIPFQGKTYASMVHGIVYGERPSARAANPVVPGSFDGVLARGMARQVEDRFANCTEFVTALDSALQVAANREAPTELITPPPNVSNPVAVPVAATITVSQAPQPPFPGVTDHAPIGGAAPGDSVGPVEPPAATGSGRAGAGGDCPSRGFGLPIRAPGRSGRSYAPTAGSAEGAADTIQSRPGDSAAINACTVDRATRPSRRRGYSFREIQGASGSREASAFGRSRRCQDLGAQGKSFKPLGDKGCTGAANDANSVSAFEPALERHGHRLGERRSRHN